MKQIIADTNIFITVALNLPQKEYVLTHTQNYSLVAPPILPFEIGNALSAMVKRKQLLAEEAMQSYQLLQEIEVNITEINIMNALQLATQHNIYAYDAYFLQLAVETSLPILTLDKGMQHVAKQINIPLIT